MNKEVKLKLLKATLNIGAVYYLVGAVVHYFGLTIFPWFDGRLYTPYHDTIISLVAIVLTLFLIAIARDPIKNIDTLNIVIISALIGSIVSIAIIWKVDFVSLGATAKKLQTVVEGVLGFIFVSALIYLYPRKNSY